MIGGCSKRFFGLTATAKPSVRYIQTLSGSRSVCDNTIMGNVLEHESSGGVEDADVIEDDLKWLAVSEIVVIRGNIAVQ